MIINLASIKLIAGVNGFFTLSNINTSRGRLSLSSLRASRMSDTQNTAISKLFVRKESIALDPVRKRYS